MLTYYIFVFVNLIFWATLGATEGFKWTPAPNLVTDKNYHIFRAFTNGAFLISIGMAPFVFSGYSIVLVIFNLLAITAFSWSFYEMMLNYVNHGSFIHQKSDFVFGNVTFKHPPAVLIPIIGIIGLLSIIYMRHFM